MRKYLILFLSLFFISCNQDTPTSVNQNSDFSIIHLHSIKKTYTNYNEAFQIAKKEKKVVFILFTTDYCRWCTKLRETTLRNNKIIKNLNNDFIVLLLDKNHSQYPKSYKIKSVPSIYLTDKNEEVFTSIIGYHKNPNDYLKWFEYIKVELSN